MQAPFLRTGEVLHTWPSPSHRKQREAQRGQEARVTKLIPHPPHSRLCPLPPAGSLPSAAVGAPGPSPRPGPFGWVTNEWVTLEHFSILTSQLLLVPASLWAGTSPRSGLWSGIQGPKCLVEPASTL